MQNQLKPMHLTKQHYDVIVIGGGASGMMAAGRAAARGKKVLLLEKNKALGEKLKISGGGRCNITNAEEDPHVLLPKYGTAEKFLYTPFSQFGVKETFEFFTLRGLQIVVEAHKRAFPVTQKALDVFRVLERYLEEGHVEILPSTNVRQLVSKNGAIEKVVTDRGEYSADAFVLSTGGMSHPETGSTGDGFQFLRDLGFAVETPTPTLVPIAVRERWVKSLSGISIDQARVTFFVDAKKKFALKGRILFTHFGLSGPTILNAAGKISDTLTEGEVTALIDTFPNIDHGTLDKEVLLMFETNKNKQLKTVFKGIAPDGMSDTILSLLTKLNPETKVHSVSKEDRKKLVQLMKALPFTVRGLMGNDLAIVSDGGLSLLQIETKTMKTKLFSNLFVTGDLLHIRRPSGGFSLQLCWTTGKSCIIFLIESIASFSLCHSEQSEESSGNIHVSEMKRSFTPFRMTQEQNFHFSLK